MKTSSGSVVTLNDIKAPVRDHLEVFEKKFRSSVKTPVPLLDTIMRYILRRKGKQIRPMFVFLSAGVCGEINESTYRAASLIELLHTATLVHDDVVDDSNIRRGFFSLNALWKNKIAVLVGDFLLSKGLLVALEHDEFDLLRVVTDATREMSEGELLQIEKARKLDIEEPVYFEIIRKKTASLIASCCAAGATSVKSGRETIFAMHRFGEYAGIAFQIKDDLFDYSTSGGTGKPNGVDIKEQKMTLPLIYLLNHCGALEKRRMINIVKNHHLEPERVAEVIAEVNRSGGMDYARTRMMEFREKAIGELAGFPDTPMRRALEQLVVFTTDRDN